LATASATWRWPAQRVSFIFGDGQRNLATAAKKEQVKTSSARASAVAFREFDF